MAAKIGQFVYSTFSNDRQIRLLKVIEQKDDTVVCSIETCSLDDAIQYCALSYVWGNASDPQNHREILLNGRRFRTTVNPVEFMQSRLSDHLPIWVDQICINQKDNEERGKQVALMGSIYTKATKVIAWPGLGTQYGAIHPYESIRAILLAWNEYLNGPSIDGNINIGRLQARRPEAFEFVRTLETEQAWRRWESHIKALVELIGHQHFSRLWTLQEIVLNQNVTYRLGLDEVPDLALHIVYSIFTLTIWPPFFSMIEANTSAKVARLNHQTLTFQEPLKYQFRFTPQEIDLATCYLIGTQRRATDPRDYVYGCLGMAHDVKPGDLMPLYDKPLLDTYRQFALFYLQKHQLQPLYYLIPRTQDLRHYPRYLQEKDDPDVILDSEGSWPSWIPTPHASFHPYFFHLEDQVGDAKVKYNEENDSVSIKGTIVGKVDSVAPALRPAGDSDAVRAQNVAQWLLNAEMAVQNIPDPYFNGQSSSEAVWRTTIYDMGDSMAEIPAPPELGDCYVAWKGHHEARLKGDNPDLSPTSMQQVQRYERLLHDKGHFTGKQQFALLEDDHLALVYYGVEEGDRVCVFQGRTAPFAIRPQTEGYLILGPIYVHGMMRGESVTVNDAPKYEDIVLV